VTDVGSFLIAWAFGVVDVPLESAASAFFAAGPIPLTSTVTDDVLAGLDPLADLRTSGAEDRSLTCFLRLADRFRPAAPPLPEDVAALPFSSGVIGLSAGLVARRDPDRRMVGSDGLRSGLRKGAFGGAPPRDCWRLAGGSAEESRVLPPPGCRCRGEGDLSKGLRMIVAETWPSRRLGDGLRDLKSSFSPM